MNFKKMQLLLVSLILFAFPTAGKAAHLSEDEFKAGESISIHGSDFGSRANEYSAVCFDTDQNCFVGDTFYTQDSFSWSDTQINVAVPGDINVEGEIIVYTEAEEEECSEYSCYTYTVSEEKASLDYKVKPAIEKISPGNIAKPGETITITGVGFGDNPGKVSFGNSYGDIVNWSYNTIEVEAPSNINGKAEGIKVYNQSGLYSEKSYIIFGGYTDDEYSYLQDYAPQINLKRAWEEVDSGSEVTVAVIDDGVYVNHPDLKGNIWRNSDEIEGNGKDDDNNGYVDDVLGYNFVDNNSIMETKGYHGSMVASIIGAKRNNQEGIAGIAKNVNIMPVIVSDLEGDFVSLSKTTEAIKYAVDNGADVINLSFGTSVTIGYTDKFNDIMEYAYKNGSVVVAAAGNGDLEGGIGRNLNNIPESPICNNQGKSIFLGVASLSNLDTESNGCKKTVWSSYGDECVNVSAPGQLIPGATPPVHSEMGNFYSIKSGTSFSAPIVSGVAALLKSQNPNMKNWEIINRIIHTADDIDEENPKYTGQLGGRINAYKALTADISSELIGISSNKVKAGEEVTLKVEGYLSDLELQLASRDFVMNFSSDQIEVESPETLILDIPTNVKSGNYSLVLKERHKKLDELENILEVTGAKTDNTTPQTEGKTEEDSIEQKTKTDSTTEEGNATDEDKNKKEDFLDKEKQLVEEVNDRLVRRLEGKILLQTEENGEGWYLNPEDNKKYFLGKPADAFNIMRELGIGISEESYNSFGDYAPEKLSGKILIRTEKNGEAYYVSPVDLKMHYLGKPKDAFQVMRNLGMGISNENIRKIEVGGV